ncbi:hypothetical protein KA977_01415 [Candidatus Dependentiae bacterium]|nr:hypothetical protein [Candidatus Dependentiae bacterium]
MHPSVVRIGFILLILGLSVYAVFFSANDYQNDPDRFLELKEKNIKSDAQSIDQKFYDEYNAGEYAFKNQKYEIAQTHFHNVYYNYKHIPKEQLKLSALHYINRIKYILEERRKNGIDTETKVKNYFESIE